MTATIAAPRSQADFDTWAAQWIPGPPTPRPPRPPREVLVFGAHAPGMPRHRPPVDLAPPPARNHPRELQAMLELAEDALRYNQAPDPRLDVGTRRGAGSNGPMGRCGPGQPNVHLDSKGVRESRSGVKLTWPTTLKLLAAQRERDPETARARDLAEAYQHLDYYGHVYGGPSECPPDLLDRLRGWVTELGGDPDYVDLAARQTRDALEG